MSTERLSPTVTLLNFGKVLVTGGVTPYENTEIPSAELFDPSTGNWMMTAALTPGRSQSTATLLNNGKVLIAGGVTSNGTTVLSSADLFSSSFSCTITLTAINGQVTGNASPYTPSTTASLTATPHPGYLFAVWTGDAAGSNNPLSILMNSDKAVAATFSPDTGDTDDDGLTNYEEIVIHGTNPAMPDTDGDGVKDSKDAFPLDPAETLDTDHDGTGDNTDPDDDGDGLSDVDEINIHGTNPKRADSDGDGLSDPSELQNHLTNPNLGDTDSDGLSDGAEVITHGTLPKVADTDGDGFLDGYEFYTGKSPLDDQDKPALMAEARTAIEFTFPAAIGKTYTIEDSFDLASWHAVESGIAGTGGQVQRFYSILKKPKRYFRVEEETP